MSTRSRSCRRDRGWSLPHLLPPGVVAASGAAAARAARPARRGARAAVAAAARGRCSATRGCGRRPRADRSTGTDVGRGPTVAAEEPVGDPHGLEVVASARPRATARQTVRAAEGRPLLRPADAADRPPTAAVARPAPQGRPKTGAKPLSSATTARRRPFRKRVRQGSCACFRTRSAWRAERPLPPVHGRVSDMCCSRCSRCSR